MLLKRKVEEMTKLGSSLDETLKILVPCHGRDGMIKTTPCSKAVGTVQRPQFCSPS